MDLFWISASRSLQIPRLSRSCGRECWPLQKNTGGGFLSFRSYCAFPERTPMRPSGWRRRRGNLIGSWCSQICNSRKTFCHNATRPPPSMEGAVLSGIFFRTGWGFLGNMDTLVRDAVEQMVYPPVVKNHQD